MRVEGKRGHVAVNKRLMLRVLVLGIIAVALGATLLTAFLKDDSPIQLGEPAPDFVLETIDGEQVRLSDYQGQGVYLSFWQSTCRICARELPAKISQYEKQHEEGIELLYINIAEARLTASNYARKHEIPFPVLLDPDRTVTYRYGVISLPTSVFIDPDGIVVGKFVGLLSEEQIEAQLELIKPDAE